MVEPRDNKAISNRVVEAINNYDLDLFDELMAPEIAEQLKQNVTEMRQAFLDYHGVNEEQISEGNKVVNRFVFHGTHQGEYMGVAPTNKKVIFTGISIDRIADGKIVGRRVEWNQPDVTRQIGADFSAGQYRNTQPTSLIRQLAATLFAAFPLYPLGVLVLFLQIQSHYTHDFYNTAHAVSLIPNVVVAWYGVGLLWQTLTDLIIYFAAGLVVTALIVNRQGSIGLSFILPYVISAALAATLAIAVSLPDFSWEALWPHLLSAMPVFVAIMGGFVGGSMLIRNTPIRKEPIFVRVLTLVACVYASLLFLTIYYAAPDPPSLPTLAYEAVDQETKGTLPPSGQAQILSNTSGYWYVLCNDTECSKDKVLAIPDKKLESMESVEFQ